MSSTIRASYDLIVSNKLYHLFRNGPNWNGWGFWAGQDDATICATYTQYLSDFWKQNQHDCNQLIQQKFSAFQIGVESIIVLWCFYQVCNGWWYYFVFQRPIRSYLQALKMPDQRSTSSQIKDP